MAPELPLQVFSGANKLAMLALRPLNSSLRFTIADVLQSPVGLKQPRRTIPLMTALLLYDLLGTWKSDADRRGQPIVQ